MLWQHSDNSCQGASLRQQQEQQQEHQHEQQRRRRCNASNRGLYQLFAAHLLLATAEGCDFATLQHVHRDWIDDENINLFSPIGGTDKLLAQLEGMALTAAFNSRTADWAAKAEWLMAKGYGWHAQCRITPFACHEDWRERLEWARAHGCPAECFTAALVEAAAAGDPEMQAALQEAYDLVLSGDGAWEAAQKAAADGNPDVLHVLLETLWRVSWGLDKGLCLQAFLEHAIVGGSLETAQWLLERLTAGNAEGDVDCMPHCFAAAAASGDKEALEALHRFHLLRDNAEAARGLWAAAAAAGSAPVLAWLSTEAYPMPDDGEPYVAAAANGDVATLRCLQRLGCPLPLRNDEGPAAAAVWARAVDRGCRLGVGSYGPAHAWLNRQGCEPASCSDASDEVLSESYEQEGYWYARAFYDCGPDFSSRRAAERLRA